MRRTQNKKGGNRRKKQTKKSKKRTYLFDDLEGKSKQEIIEMRADTKDALQTANIQRVELQKERNQLVEIVQEMRKTFKGRTKERGELLDRLKKAQSERNQAQKNRDNADEKVPPSPEDIERSLKQRHKPLSTMMNDLREMPTLKREIALFESFFEYQEMHKIAIFANDEHKKMMAAMNEIKSVMQDFKKLDKKTEEENAKLELKSEEEKNESNKLGWKEIERISSRINEIDEKRKKIKQEIGTLTNELHRIEAFQRMQSDAARRIEFNPEEIREKAASGGTLSLQDLSTLISSGGLENLNDSEKNDGSGFTKTDRKKKTRRRSNARRGKARTSTLTPKEERKD
ncbi:MAG: hypothetical protein CMB72_05810 [Euryarchaeota archaeon]|nr:hypothetical protein [Euryarchaeota archaeon]